MKKLLLTTALVGATVASGAIAGGEPYSAPAYAGTPAAAAAPAGLAVTIGGFIDFQAGIADQEAAFETGANSRDTKFQNDTEIHVGVEGTADNGLTYGAVIELNADISADGDADGTNADKTYIYLESSAGRLELGGNAGAEHTLKVDASSIARATGGVDGDFYDFINLAPSTGTAGAAAGLGSGSSATGGTGFIITPDLPSQHATAVREDATKITYYTPRFSGFQAGVSFTPDEGDGGTAAGFTGVAAATTGYLGNQEDVFGLGLNYTGEFEGVGVQASATGAFGGFENATREDLSAYAFGLGLTFEGFALAGSYGDWDDSASQTNVSGLTVTSEGSYYTLGAAYETGPFGVSVNYLESEIDLGGTSTGTNEFSNLVFGADYQLAPGLVPYVEVALFDADQAGTATDNEGSVLLIGTELTF